MSVWQDAVTAIRGKVLTTRDKIAWLGGRDSTPISADSALVDVLQGFVETVAHAS